MTVSGATTGRQVKLARDAVAAGASYLMVRPPVEPARTDSGARPRSVLRRPVLEAIEQITPSVSVGIQNAPEYADIGLDSAALAPLRPHVDSRL